MLSCILFLVPLYFPFILASTVPYCILASFAISLSGHGCVFGVPPLLYTMFYLFFIHLLSRSPRCGPVYY